MNRLLLELGAGVLLCAAFVGWWQWHDHAEQKIGATECIHSTTDLKTQVAADNSGIETAHAAQISQVVKTYEAQVASLSAGNAALVAGLHHQSLRQSAAAGAGSAACDVPAVQLPAGQSGPADPIDVATTKVFNDCDADYAALIGVTAAYNDWRQKMIEANRGR